MSIEIPKYSIQETYEAPSFMKKTLPVFALIFGVVIGGFGYKYYEESAIKSMNARNQILEGSQIIDQQKIEKLEVKLSQLKAENKIKNEAVQLLQNDYKNQIDIQNGLNSEISFYQQLLSPNAENKGLRVFGNTIFDLNDNNFMLETTLVQKIQKAKIISGRFEISILGKQEGNQKNIGIHKKDDSKYQFKYFHKISLNFSLPKGFKAEQLVVRLYPQNKKSKLIEQTVSWASLIQ